MVLQIFFLIFALVILFWLLSLLVAAIAGAPTVYAKDEAIKKAFDLAGLNRGQTVVDLGCGNARSLIIAAKNYGAKGVGVEISPFYYLLAKLNIALHGESKNIKIYFGNLKSATRRVADLVARVDVVFLYLFPSLLEKIEPWLFGSIKPSGKIVSISFRFKNHKPTQTVSKPKVSLYLRPRG